MPLYPQLFTVATAILGNNSDDAADAVQDTMVKLWNTGDALSDIRQPQAYAISVLRTTVIDMLRRRHPVDTLDESISITEIPASDTESAAFLEHIISNLPASQQEVIKLSAFAGMSSHEIAQATGLTDGNVRQLLSRGRKKIKELYYKYL